MQTTRFINTSMNCINKRPLVRVAGWIGIALLNFNIKCVEIADEKGRKEQIENTASSLGEHVLWKKIEKTKGVIDTVYTKIQALQDSIDAAKYTVNTIINLGIASIENELLELHDYKLDLDAYVSRVPDNAYGLMLSQLYRQEDVVSASEQFTDVIFYADHLPTTVAGVDQRVADRQGIQMHFNEFADKRSMQAAQVYRKWSRLYRDKGMELSRKVLTDKAFGMTDYERIETQRLAQKYVVLSYEFIDKSDSILLAVNEYQDPIKNTHQQYLESYLHLQNLFEQ